MTYSRHRLEALSDGIFAIAMTLLILDIKVPVEVPHGTLAAVLSGDLHEWVSFVVTFALAAIYWSVQHRAFEEIDEFGRESLLLTFVFLGFVTVLPFSTALWGHHISEPLAYTLYFLNQLLIAAALTTKVLIARARGHLHPSETAQLLIVRLSFLTAVLLTATISSVFLPPTYVVFPMIPIALAGRFYRYRRQRRLSAIALRPAAPHS